MMYSPFKLNKQGDNIQPWHTPFPIWNQSAIPHPVLTVAAWSAYRFLKKQVRWLVWYSHLLKNFPQFIVIHTVKGFGIVNKAEKDVFMELSGFLHDLSSLIFSFKLALSFSSITLIEKLFSSSLLSAIRVVSSTYLRLLMSLSPILRQLVTDSVKHFSRCA